MTQKSTSALNGNLNALLPDNDLNLITPDRERTALRDGYDSAWNNIDYPDLNKGVTNSYFYIDNDTKRIRFDPINNQLEVSTDSGVTWNRLITNNQELIDIFSSTDQREVFGVVASIDTTDDTPTPLVNFDFIDGAWILETYFKAYRTSGAGSAGDQMTAYRRYHVKCVSGVVSVTGTTPDDVQDVGTWDFTDSVVSNQITISFTGAVGTNITAECTGYRIR